MLHCPNPLAVGSPVKLVLRSVATVFVFSGAAALLYLVVPRVDASSESPQGVRAASAAGLAAVALDSLEVRAALPEARAAEDTAEPGQDSRADFPGSNVPPTSWLRPIWFPAVNDVDAVSRMDRPRVGRSGGRVLSVRSRSAFVYDLDSGEVLYEKNADVVRPVASLTKMVSALALMSVEPNLETELCVSAAQYPTRSGARSRLSTGDCLSGWDVLGAALVASDNRGALALAAIAGLDMDDFVARMNEVSVDLAMASSSWSDPSGLEDENLSTARDIARATVAVAAHPVLSVVATAPYWDLHRVNRVSSVRRLFSTDRLLGRDDIDVLAAKTGYTDTARYCFSSLVQTQDGRRLAIALLGADGKLTRWADMERILRWVAEPG